MRYSSFRRLFVLALLSTLTAAAADPLYAATPELDALAAEVAAFVDAGARDGRKSLRLSVHLGWSERIAGYEKDPVKRAELLEKLAGLRRSLADSSIAAARAAGAGDKANGAFSGRVTDDGTPLESVDVAAYAIEGGYYGSTRTGADGRYAMSLPPGTYVLYAEPPYSSTLSPQLHDGINCRLYSSCQPFDGHRVVLPSGGHQAIDFALADLGRIEGQVRDAETMAPVATHVKVFGSDGSHFGSVPVSADGSYTFGGLHPGSYFVVAAGRGGLAGMVYQGVPCNVQDYSYQFTCPREPARAVTLAVEQVVTGIDLFLLRGGVIEGRAIAAASGAALIAGAAKVFTPAYGFVADSYLSVLEGTFRIEGLAPGLYYLTVSVNGYTPQFHERNNCDPGPHCLPSSRAIEVFVGETYNFDFRLDLRGSLTGRVLDDRSGLPIHEAEVEIWDRAAGTVYGWTRSDTAGFYSFSNLPAIEMAVSSRHQDYRGEFFDDVDENLGPAGAKALKILPGQIVAGIDLELARRGELSARVVAAESGDPLGCSFTVVPVSDPWAYSQLHYCDADGLVRVSGLLPGFYYVAAHDYQRARHLYGKGSCNLYANTYGCDFREGAPVEVKSGEETRLGDLPLERAGTLEAYASFQPLSGQVAQLRGFLRLFENDGTELPAVGLYGPYSSAFYTDLAPGTYRLVLDGSPNWQSFAYPSVPCGRWFCDPQRGEEIVVAANQTVSLVEIQAAPLAPYTGCTPGETALCLNQGRYRVSATWRDFAGASGAGTARGLTADSGYFYFFSPGNLEVLVKVLDGCDQRLGHHFWFYAAGLTNVQVELRVEDTLTGTVELYSNALGSTFQPILDSAAFATCDAAGAAPPAGPEASGPEASGDLGAPRAPAAQAAAPPIDAAATDYCNGGLYFCLGNRFEVGAYFRTASGQEGYAGRSLVTPDTATFTFFDYSNVELVVKVLDACSTALPGHWVFASGLTDVAVELTITDRATGRTKTYDQPLGPYAPVIDLVSFPCD